MEREHILKCWPEYFDAIKAGIKPFEVRRDDRGFQRGDILILQRTGNGTLGTRVIQPAAAKSEQEHDGREGDAPPHEPAGR